MVLVPLATLIVQAEMGQLLESPACLLSLERHTSEWTGLTNRIDADQRHWILQKCKVAVQRNLNGIHFRVKNKTVHLTLNLREIAARNTLPE